MYDISFKEEDRSDDGNNALPPLKEQRRILALAERIFVSSGYPDNAVLQGNLKVQSSVCADISKVQKQTKIDHFSNKLNKVFALCEMIV